MTTITEAAVEEAALDWLSGLGWQVGYGSDIALSTPAAEWHNCLGRRRSRPINWWRGRHTTPSRGDSRGRFTRAIHKGDSRIAPTTTV